MSVAKRHHKTQTIKVRRRRKVTGPRTKTKKAVRRNTQVINKLLQTTFPVTPYQHTDTGVIEAATHTFLITQPNNWEQCFRSHEQPNTDVPRSYDLRNVKLKWAAQCESASSGNQWLSIFVVSLRPKTARKVLERTTNLSNLEKGLDYIAVDLGSDEPVTLQGEGFYMLNPALYRIHYRSGVRRIGQSTMGADEAVTNVRDSTTRGGWTVPFKRTFKADEYHQDGFRSIDSSHLEPQNQLYMLMLSNASESSGIFLTANYLLTGRQATSW